MKTTFSPEELASEAAALTMAMYHRVLLHMAKPRLASLPSDPHAHEHKILRVLRGYPEQVAPLVARAGREYGQVPRAEISGRLRTVVKAHLEFAETSLSPISKAIKGMNFHSKSSLVPKYPIGAPPKYTLLEGNAEPIGQVSQGLPLEAHGSFYVYKVECISNSKPHGYKDNLIGHVSLVGPNAEYAEGAPWIEDFMSGETKDVKILNPDSNATGFGASVSIPATSVGKQLFATVTLVEDDHEWLAALLDVLHAIGVKVVEAVVRYYSSSPELAKLAAEAADYVGGYIHAQIKTGIGDDWLGTAVIPWSILPWQSSLQPVDIISEEHESHYRLHFQWNSTNMIPNFMDEVKERPIEFKKITDPVFVDLAVAGDGSGTAWAVKGDGELVRFRGMSYETMGQGYKKVAVGSASWVVALTTDGRLMEWRQGGFERIGGNMNLVEIGIGSDGAIFGLDAEGRLLHYRRHRRFMGNKLDPRSVVQVDSVFSWEELGEKISGFTSPRLDLCHALDARGGLLVYKLSPSVLAPVPTIGSCKGISMANDKAMYGVSEQGALQFFVRSAAGGDSISTWRFAENNVGRLAKVAVSRRDIIFVLDAAGAIWRHWNIVS